MNFKERKRARTEHYNKSVKGWKSGICIACNGSGRYDSFNSPPCSSCNGTGKTRVRPR